jgi:hypothetical protein
MLKDHSRIVLNTIQPCLCLEPGDVGVIVHNFGEGAAYEVEFMTLDGETVGVETVKAGNLRPVGEREIPHARALLAA